MRVDLKCFHYKKRNDNYVIMEVTDLMLRWESFYDT